MSTVNFTFTANNRVVRIDADHPRKKFSSLGLMDSAISQLLEKFGSLTGEVFTVSTTARRGAWKIETIADPIFDGDRYRTPDRDVLDVCIEGVQTLMDLRSNEYPLAIYISKNR